MAINPLQQPIQYGPQAQDPAQALLQGLQIGGAIRGMRQQRRQEAEAARTKEQFSLDMQSYLSNPTAAASRELILKYPQMREVVAENWSSLSKEMQDEEFKFATNVSMALRSNPEVAARLIEQRRDAFANAGMDTTSLDTMLETAKTNPTALPVMANLYGASINPEKWGDYVKALEAKPGYRVLTDAEAREQVPNYTQGLAYQVSPQGKIELIRGAEAGAGVDASNVQSSMILEGGTVVSVLKNGDRLVRNALGDIVTGQEAADAIKEAQEYGAELQGVRSGERAKAAFSQKRADAAFTQLEKIRGNISNLQEVNRLIDEGADTGVISSKLPSWRASSIALNSAKNRLGLDVVGSVTFGALSEAELELALQTALPTGLNQDELKDWVNRKIAAQEKLADYLEQQVSFLSEPGNSQADWLKFIKEKGAQGEAGAPAAPSGGIDTGNPLLQ